MLSASFLFKESNLTEIAKIFKAELEIKHILEKLLLNQFVRIHRSFIIPKIKSRASKAVKLR